MRLDLLTNRLMPAPHPMRRQNSGDRTHKKRTHRDRYVRFCLWSFPVRKNYSTKPRALGSVSQMSSQAPQSMHSSVTMQTSLPSTTPSLMASVGHSSMHFLQKLQSSGLIAYIIGYLQLFFLGPLIVPQFQKNAITNSQNFFVYFDRFRAEFLWIFSINLAQEGFQP